MSETLRSDVLISGGGLVGQEAAVVAQAEAGLFDLQRVAAVREGGADAQQLVLVHRHEADLVEEA